MSWPIVASGVIYLVSWAICLLMLYVVPRRRDPESAGGWLLFSFFLPYLAALLFFLIGSPKLPRARRERQRALDQALASLRLELEDDPQLANIFVHTLEPRRQQVAALVERLGGMSVMHGDVALLSDYSATIDRIAADIDAAHRYVHLLYYIFADDTSGRKVADALCRAAERGVICRVLYDGLGNTAYLGQLAARLKAASIEVHPVLPLQLFGAKRLRPDLRNHRKIAVIDGRIGYTGSQNITEATFKPGIVYEELVARVTGPIVAQLAAVFFADWLSEAEASVPPAERPDLRALAAAGAATPCQVLPSGPAYDTDNIALLFGTLLFAAQHRAVLTTPYFIPDAFVLRAIESAARRGVDVQLIVSEQGDQFLVSRAQRSYYEEMLDAGVTIQAVRQPAFIHAKHLSIDDDITVIGSSNFDVRSFRLNLELVLLAYDERVVAAQRVIEAGYLARANTIALDDWLRRPRRQQFVENTCRLVSALL
jgi:cardiolipin synthase A/B